jgi:hypothetical protein
LQKFVHFLGALFAREDIIHVKFDIRCFID